MSLAGWRTTEVTFVRTGTHPCPDHKSIIIAVFGAHYNSKLHFVQIPRRSPLVHMSQNVRFAREMHRKHTDTYFHCERAFIFEMRCVSKIAAACCSTDVA